MQRPIPRPHARPYLAASLRRRSYTQQSSSCRFHFQILSRSPQRVSRSSRKRRRIQTSSDCLAFRRALLSSPCSSSALIQRPDFTSLPLHPCPSVPRDCRRASRRVKAGVCGISARFMHAVCTCTSMPTSGKMWLVSASSVVQSCRVGERKWWCVRLVCRLLCRTYRIAEGRTARASKRREAPRTPVSLNRSHTSTRSIRYRNRTVLRLGHCRHCIQIISDTTQVSAVFCTSA